MDKIAIVTDSIACFTREMVERYWIRIVPSNTHFDGRFYKEYLNTSSTEAIKGTENVRDKVNLLALMETMRHAYRSGRIPKVAARIC